MSKNRRLGVAVLGAGTVGEPVVRALLEREGELEVRAGCRLELVGVAVRDVDAAIGRGLPAELLTDAPAHLVAAPEVDVVVELMSGDEPAATLIDAALASGKAVVTANKHVLAQRGSTLEATARRTGAAFRFEATVAGGTPVLGPLAAELAANRIVAIHGILNGTTNFILSAMGGAGRTYDDALEAAQRAGYAESDPRADVEGLDAANKVVILTRLGFGRWLDPASIQRCPPTVVGVAGPGISAVGQADIAGAAQLGLTIKLIGRMRLLDDGRLIADALPTAVKAVSPFGRTGGVVNRVEVEAEPVGRVAFEGPGAGGATTSSAILGDLIAVARGEGSTWAGLPEAAGPAAGPAAGATADAEPARRFFTSALPEQLVRDQVDIEVARGGGFVSAPRPLDDLQAALAAAGVEATLFPIETDR